MVIIVGLLFLGWKLLRKRREGNKTEGRAEVTGIGKPTEMATADRNWHAEELPAGYEGQSGVRGYVDRG
jgi:hypothetical protein